MRAVPHPSPPAPLRAWRGSAGEATEPDASACLHRQVHGPVETGDRAAPRLLHPLAPQTEAWFGATGVRHHHDDGGLLHWACDGQWLHATTVVDDRVHPQGLVGAARQAYESLFTLLDRSGCRHPLKIWNYLAQINAVTDLPPGVVVPEAGRALERYRQFNAGRQQAFLAAHRSAFDGAPAACALGTDGGPLTVHLLAGRTAPIPIENPRQVSAYRYPRDHGPAAPSFSRAARLRPDPQRTALFVSGTASIVGHHSLHIGDVQRQTAESLINLDLLLVQAASDRASDPTPPHADTRADAQALALALDYTVYLRDAADLAAVRTTFEDWLSRHGDGPGRPCARRTLYLRADICRAELLVEIEAHGLLTHGAPA